MGEVSGPLRVVSGSSRGRLIPRAAVPREPLGPLLQENSFQQLDREFQDEETEKKRLSD